jgi:hypothetical protein
MIDLAELISRTRTRYDHATTVRWSDAKIALSLNEGLETLAEETHFYERYATLPIENNRIWYDLRGFTPETPLRVKSIWSTARNQWLVPQAEDHLQFRWKDSTGDPHQWFPRGIYWIGVWPRPSTPANGGYLRVYFASVPSRRVHTQEVLSDLPDNYVPALIDYALYDMSAKDKEPQKAIRHFQNYLTREKALKNHLDDRLVGSTAAVLGGMAGWKQ